MWRTTACCVAGCVPAERVSSRSVPVVGRGRSKLPQSKDAPLECASLLAPCVAAACCRAHQIGIFCERRRTSTTHTPYGSSHGEGPDRRVGVHSRPPGSPLLGIVGFKGFFSPEYSIKAVSISS